MRDDPRTIAALPPEMRPETGPRKESKPSLPRRSRSATMLSLACASYAPPAPPSCRQRTSFASFTASERSHERERPSAILASR
jgi:hypothetical protein